MSESPRQIAETEKGKLGKQKGNKKMSEESKPQVVVMRAPKTGAPMVLGTIAFILSLPGMLCATACSAVCSGFEKGGAQTNVSGFFWFVAWTLIIVAFANFIACFRCKGPKSRSAGIFIIWTTVPFMILSVLIGIVFDLVPSVLFFIAGSYCISNASRPE